METQKNPQSWERKTKLEPLCFMVLNYTTKLQSSKQDDNGTIK